MNRIFITGGSGLLALNWALAIKDNFSVTLGLYDRDISLQWVETKFVNLESVPELTDFLLQSKTQIVIHTAGLTSVEVCEAQPDLAKHINTDLSYNVAQACFSLGIKMVHISTDHLFSGNIPLVDENHVTDPQNVHGKTKADAEIRVIQVNPSALIVRTNFYGWGPSYRTSFSDLIINTLRKGKEINLFYDVYYTPILVEKLVFLVHELLGNNANGIFNVVSNERISKYEFGLKLAEQFNLDSSLIKPVSITDNKELVRRPNDLSLSNMKASVFIGKSFGSIDEDIRRLFDQENLYKFKVLRSL